MIKQLRRRVIKAAMISVACVLIIVITAINLLNYKSVVDDFDEKLEVLNENDGDYPEHPKKEPSTDEGEDNESESGESTPIDDIFDYPEAKYENLFFTMLYDDGEFYDVDRQYYQTISEEEAIAIAKNALLFKTESGFYGDFGSTRIFRYMISETKSGTRITFLDCTVSLESFYKFFAISVIISLVSLLAVYIIMLIFASKIISPMVESYQKQKLFITNAGHDIKTPITVIDADREILELEIGENEWLNDIKKQTKRLAKLTNDLIYLSRMDEGNVVKEFSPFSLSDLCIDEVESFSAVALKNGLDIKAETEDETEINGSEGDIRKLLAILLDNAIKYAKRGTVINVSVTKHGIYTQLKISNVAESLTEDQMERIFERFYRVDGARSSEGGFGIGLATAQAIVISHNGKITAELTDAHIFSIISSFPVKTNSLSLITNLIEKAPKSVKNVNNSL